MGICHVTHYPINCKRTICPMRSTYTIQFYIPTRGGMTTTLGRAITRGGVLTKLMTRDLCHSLGNVICILRRKVKIGTGNVIRVVRRKIKIGIGDGLLVQIGIYIMTRNRNFPHQNGT